MSHPSRPASTPPLLVSFPLLLHFLSETFETGSNLIVRHLFPLCNAAAPKELKLYGLVALLRVFHGDVGRRALIGREGTSNVARVVSTDDLPSMRWRLRP